MTQFVLWPLTSFKQDGGIGISLLKTTCIVHDVLLYSNINLYPFNLASCLHRPVHPGLLAVVHTKRR